MSFLNPILAAAGLACIALPILIHILMRRRRKPVTWGAMRFLEQAYKRQRKRIRFEQWLLLAARCVLVAALALALGRPLLGAAGVLGQRPARTLFLLVDNSVASSITTGSGTTALDGFRTKATELLKSLASTRGDRVAIITLAGPASALVLPPTSDLSAAEELLRTLPQEDSRADMRGGLELVASASREGQDGVANAEIVVLSEFRAGSFDARSSPPLMGSMRDAQLIFTTPATLAETNVAVRELEVLQPLVLGSQSGSQPTPIPVRVTLSRSGVGASSEGSTAVSVLLAPASGGSTETSPRTTITVPWTAGQETASALGLLSVPPRAEAERSDSFIASASVPPDSLARDDSASTPVRARSRLDVYILAQAAATAGEGRIDAYGPAEWLSLALAPQAAESERRRLDADIRVTTVDPTVLSQVTAVSEADAILVPRPDLLDAGGWVRVKDALKAGAFVLVSAPPRTDVHTWSDGMLADIGLTWTIAREPVAHETALTISPARSLGEGVDPLALLASELEELVKPVSVKMTLPVSGPAGSFDTVLSLSDGSPLLVMARPGAAGEGAARGAGIAAYLTTAVDLAWTDLPTKPLMVPLLQELVKQGVGRGGATTWCVAGQRPPLPRGCTELVEINAKGAGRTLSGVAGVGEQTARSAGLFAARGPAGETISHVAVNADGAGSDVGLVDSASVQRWLAQTGLGARAMSAEGAGPQGTSGGQNDGRSHELPVSLPLLVLGAAVALAEMFMARAFSHAGATT